MATYAGEASGGSHEEPRSSPSLYSTPLCSTPPFRAAELPRRTFRPFVPRRRRRRFPFLADLLPPLVNSEREQFRRYLEKSGVLSFLTNVLAALYEEPEKPSSALDFLKHHLSASPSETAEIESLRLELAEIKEKYEAVLEENKKIKSKEIRQKAEFLGRVAIAHGVADLKIQLILALHE